MIIKNGITEKCPCCGILKQMEPPIVGCDQCSRELEYNGDRFDLTVFLPSSSAESGDTLQFIFCSPLCARNKLDEVLASDIVIDFFSLPTLDREQLKIFLKVN